MIRIILFDWGPETPDPQYSPFLADEEWSKQLIEHDNEYYERRRAWLANASADWLDVVADLVDNPPDFIDLYKRYRHELEDLWTWSEDESGWLNQIETMLDDWVEIEPERVSPILARIEERRTAIDVGSPNYKEPVYMVDGSALRIYEAQRLQVAFQ